MVQNNTHIIYNLLLGTNLKNFYRTLLTLLFTLTLFSCSNNDKLEESRNKESLEAQEIAAAKKNRKKEIDSLQKEISELKNKKENFLSQNQIDFLKAEIYYNLQKSYFDHILIGVKNLEKQTETFRKLGFSIKKGKQHKNGIKNNFIEFGDSSEIELIEVQQASDKLSEKYKKLIDKNIYGLQFALRVNNVKKLKDNFSKLNSDFTILSVNKDYSILSKNKMDKGLPVFFIQYNIDNNNTLTSHSNGSKGIYSIWLSTNDIKNTAQKLSDMGFKLIGNYELPGIKGKAVEFTNSNFKIILIKSKKNEITGITILVDNLELVKNNLKSGFDTDFIEYSANRGKSIFINKELTNSVWIEFLEPLN